MSRPTIERLVEIAAEAGDAILAIYDTDFDATLKGDGSPVTQADEAAEAIILRRLSEETDTPVVAEEAVSAGKIPTRTGFFYLVDPLDGTREFLSKNGEFTVNIALIEDGVPVEGVVYTPALKTMYVGSAAGAWRAEVVNGTVGEKTPISVGTPQDELRVVASRSHLTDETKAFVERFTVGSFVSSGSSLKFCRVAEGAADLYPRLGRTMEWDTAAGHAVLGAAGGRVLQMDGSALTYGKYWPGDGGDTFANPYFVATGRFHPFT